MSPRPVLDPIVLAAAAAAAVVAVAGVGAQERPQPDADGAAAIVFRTVEDVELRLHVYRPDGWRATDRRAAIVLFFGGGWRGGTPAQFAPQCGYLATRGMVAIAAEYRVASRHGTTPFECVEDGRAAVAWVRAHAAQLGVDPRRVAAGGGSAGGHVAACTALVPDAVAASAAGFRPDALVLFNPVIDTGPRGFGHRQLGGRWRDISPVDHVRPGAPPTLVLHGTVDRTVPFENAMRFRDAMAAADNHCELRAFAGRGHGFFNRRRGQIGDHVRTARAMDRFLASLGWLDGPPTLAEPGATCWHGYTRRDLQVAGRAAILVEPDRPAPGRPWIWRARFFGHQPQADVALLEEGFAVVHVDVADLFGNDAALAAWDACWETMTTEHGLARTPALECMSRGALVAFRWAARHPERVACIYADAPVCDIRSWPGGRGVDDPTWRRCLAALGLDHQTAEHWGGNPIDVLEPLAARRVPILCVCGDADAVVPLDDNARVVAGRYRALGGPIRMIVKPGVGHHPHSLGDPGPIVDFVLRHTVGSRDAGGDWSTLRQGLARCRARWNERGVGRVAFLGGSITHNPGWRDLVCDDLRERSPDVAFEFVNAGVPSFGSMPGAFRLRRDVLRHGAVDLLFVEAAVNDAANGRSATEMLRGMEGIVRAARRADPFTDIVMLHFADPAKLERIRRGTVPEVIAVHERVAESYGVPSIDLATEVTARIDAGEFGWRDDFVDLHPAPFGQRLYAASVRRLFDRAWPDPVPDDAAPAPLPLPSPLDPASWARGDLVAPDAARVGEGFVLDESWEPTDRAGTRSGFVRVPMLVAAAPGACFTLAFTGSAVGVMVVAGPDAGVVEHRVDDGEWHTLDLFTRWSARLHCRGVTCWRPGSREVRTSCSCVSPSRHPGAPAARARCGSRTFWSTAPASEDLLPARAPPWDNRRVDRDRTPWRRTIDLHGTTAEQAIARLRDDLRRCFEQRCALLVVVHGRGWRSQGKAVLPRVVRDWLGRLREHPRSAVRRLRFGEEVDDAPNPGCVLVDLALDRRDAAFDPDEPEVPPAAPRPRVAPRNRDAVDVPQDLLDEVDRELRRFEDDGGGPGPTRET